MFYLNKILIQCYRFVKDIDYNILKLHNGFIISLIKFLKLTL